MTGLFAVHGVVDDGNDRSWPGAFTKTAQERGPRIRLLWGHDFMSPPTAKINWIREVGVDSIPSDVLEKSPSITGAVEIEREYLPTPRGDEVLAGIKAGAITEMSYAYDAVKFDFEEHPHQEGWKVRNLREVRLHEVSDVLWGMNPATVGSKSPSLFDSIITYLNAMHAQKSGARHSTTDIELINQIADAALKLGATNVQLIEAIAGGKSRSTQAEQASLAREFTQMQKQLMALELSTFF